MQNALTTPELFRLLSLSIGKEKPASAYKVAQVFQVSDTASRNWERGFVVMDEANAEKAAVMLGMDLEFVILSLQAERMNKSNLDKIAAIFERAALATQHRAASIFIGVLTLSTLPLAGAVANSVCGLC